MNQDRVLQALKALAEADGEREAPPGVEARLLRELRSRRALPRWRWLGIAAMAAGIVITTLLLAKRTPKPTVSAVSPVTSSLSEVVEVARPASARSVVATAAPPKVARELAPVRRMVPRELVTDFFPLMNPAPPFERGQILRVQIPAAAMRTVGLPVREEHLADAIQADVLVGEEGMPRAIRFVRFDVK